MAYATYYVQHEASYHNVIAANILLLIFFYHIICSHRDVMPNEKHVTHKEVFTPEHDGQRTVTVSFNSKQLTDIKNTITATVLP